MGRPRPKRGERRIDAAIDHLAQYGFPRPQIPQDHQQPPTGSCLLPFQESFFFFASCNPLVSVCWFMIFVILGSQYSVILLSRILLSSSPRTSCPASNDGNEKPASFSPKIVTCILDSCNFVADGCSAVEIFVRRSRKAGPFSPLQEPTGRPRFCFVGYLVPLYFFFGRFIVTLLDHLAQWIRS